MKKITKTTIAAISLVLVNFNTQANVIDSANVAGLKTFQDTNTGRVWLDMNNFFDAASNNGTTGNDMITTAQNAGFTFAALTDVHQLLDSLPLNSGEWSSYAQIMGYGIPRNLIWGMYDDSNGDPFGWAYAFQSDTSWNYNDNAINASSIANQGSIGNVDMGLWAYQTGTIANVPETTDIALLSAGFAGLGAMRRRRRIQENSSLFFN